jgi:hypothetical protein
VNIGVPETGDSDGVQGDRFSRILDPSIRKWA